MPTQTYTTPGEHPLPITSQFAIVSAASIGGGGGGGNPAIEAQPGGNKGAGGGSYAAIGAAGPFDPATLTVTVGAGGTSASLNGGTSSITSGAGEGLVNYVAAPGGTGVSAYNIGGTGGAAGVGDTTFAGGDGGAGHAGSAVGGGGGAAGTSAGAGGVGGDASDGVPGTGGAPASGAYTDPGSGGTGSVDGATSPEAGYAYGGGAGGVGSFGTGTGGGGWVSITWHQAPTSVSLSANTLPTAPPIGTTVGTLSSVDPDDGDTITYTLAAGITDNDLFAIDGTTVETADDLPDGTYTITVTATDSYSLVAEQTFTITVESPSTRRRSTMFPRIQGLLSYGHLTNDTTIGATLSLAECNLSAVPSGATGVLVQSTGNDVRLGVENAVNSTTGLVLAEDDPPAFLPIPSSGAWDFYLPGGTTVGLQFCF